MLYLHSTSTVTATHTIATVSLYLKEFFMTLWAFSIICITAACWFLWCWFSLLYNLFGILNAKNVSSSATISEDSNTFAATSPSCNIDIKYIIYRCIFWKVDSRRDSITRLAHGTSCASTTHGNTSLISSTVISRGYPKCFRRSSIERA